MTHLLQQAVHLDGDAPIQLGLISITRTVQRGELPILPEVPLCQLMGLHQLLGISSQVWPLMLGAHVSDQEPPPVCSSVQSTVPPDGSWVPAASPQLT